MHNTKYTFQQNEKTGICKQPIAKFESFDIYEGAIFEPVVDFSARTRSYKPKELTYYYFENNRFKRIKRKHSAYNAVRLIRTCRDF